MASDPFGMRVAKEIQDGLAQAAYNKAGALTAGVTVGGYERPTPRLYGVQIQILGNGFLLSTQYDQLSPCDGFRPLFAKDHDECAEMIRKLLANVL